MLTSRERAGGVSSQARILVCDDAPTVRAFMATVLGLRYNVQLTHSGEDALALAPSFAPDLVITDHLLPGISGRELVTRLRAIPAFEDVPIILLTAIGDADSRADGIEAGADEYLVKPVRERELIARVSALLRLRRTLFALSRRSRELQEANAALHAAQQRLLRTERLAALGSLAAALAHDLNNPLATIKSGASALLAITDEAAALPDGIDPSRVVALLREMGTVASEVADASRRMEAVGRDLRLFGSGDATSKESLRVEDAVRSAVSLAAARVRAPPDIQVRVTGAPAVEAAPHLVTLVLLSVLERAVVAAGAAGHVEVTVIADGKGVEIAVRDDGPRIPDAILPRVFEPFVRDTSPGEPAGLGLSVAAGIVQGLGGHIDVDANPTAGACFRVWLPTAR
jgi:signal transduction histidine kinase